MLQKRKMALDYVPESTLNRGWAGAMATERPIAARNLQRASQGKIDELSIKSFLIEQHPVLVFLVAYRLYFLRAVHKPARIRNRCKNGDEQRRDFVSKS